MRRIVQQLRPVADLLRSIADGRAPWPTEVTRQAQDALAASERKYRNVYERSSDMHLTCNSITDEIVDCNQTLCKRLGYAKAELVGQPYYLLYPPEYREQLQQARAVFDAQGDLVDVERVLRCKDGRLIEVSLSLRGVRDANGRVVEAHATWRDISARKQAERDRMLLLHLGGLQRSMGDGESFLRAACDELATHFRVASCALVELDRPFGRLLAEHALRGPTAVVCDVASDPRIPPSEHARYDALGVAAFVAVPLLRKGDWAASFAISDRAPRRWEDREVALLQLAAEHIWLWIEHLQLIAEIHDRDIHEARCESEARFRIMVDAVQDYAIYGLDRHGVVASWNVGAQRLKGYTADEVIGRSFAMFYTSEDQAHRRPSTVLDIARRTGRYEEEGWRVRKDGTMFWAAVVLTAMRGPGGEIDGFAKVTRDISERRRRDEELQTQQAQLTRRLEERDVLLKEIHHRVKNNLQVISSLIKMQIRRLELGHSREALEECRTRVLAIALIHEKLYQSRDYSQVQFGDYARSVAASVFRTLGMSQADVKLELAIEEIPLVMDRAIPCGLMINELITNALKHAFPDGRRGMVRVSMTRVDRGLCLEVRDNGVGLSPTCEIRTAKSMGLQLVVTLTKQLSGELEVSTDGGTAFRITFPATSR